METSARIYREAEDALAEVNAGDEVYLTSPYSRASLTKGFTTVKRTTKTQVIVQRGGPREVRFRRDTGKEIGGSKNYPLRIRAATPELRALIKEENYREEAERYWKQLRRDLAERIKKGGHKFPVEVLEQVKAILDPVEEEYDAEQAREQAEWKAKRAADEAERDRRRAEWEAHNAK